MEAKAVMTAAMSRRSREHRSSKNVINATGTIQESSSSLVASQLDIRRSSRLTRSSLSNPGAVSLSKGLDARANVAKALMSAGNSSVIVAESVEALRADDVVDEAGGHTVVSSTVRQPHVVDANHVSPLPGPDAAGQGRPLRGRPRGRHVAPVKKIAKRAKRLQEVPLSESDGARILGRRIKVFWRDENKWFYGVVKAYNRGRKSHKIVYDDKEEEWLKLHEEKFKLQVLDGEVFGVHEPVLSRPSEEPTSRSSFGASSRLTKLKHVNAASSANGGIPAQNGFIREDEDDYPGFRNGSRDFLQQSPEAGVVNAGGAVEEFEGATPMVCESVDLEDPYAIDHTSISDSLVMFMRSKQSLAESRKVLATTSPPLPPSPQPATVAANPIEVSSSVEPSSSSDKVEISNVVITSSPSSKASPLRPVVCDIACTLDEERGVSEGISCEDGKGSLVSELVENNTQKGGEDLDLDALSDPEDPYAIDQTSISDSLVMFMRSKQSLVESAKVVAIQSPQPAVERGAPERISCEDGKGSSASLKTGDVDSTTEPNASDVLDSSEGGGLHFNGQQHVESEVIENLVSSPLDVVEDDVRPETPDHAQDAHDIDSDNGVIEHRILIKTYPEYGSSVIVASEIEDYDLDMRVERIERFISWYIARDLVKIDCSIPGPNFSSWIVDVDSEWKCVPYLTLFLLERDISQTSPCLFPRDHISRYIALRTSRLVLQGSRTDSPLLLTERAGGFVEANPPCPELPCSFSELEPCQAVISEQPLDSIVTEQPTESVVPEQQPGEVICLPDPEVLDSGVEELHLVGDLDIDDVDLPPGFEEDASAAPHENPAEDDFVGDTVLAVGSGSAVGLTEVQIGIVEGEDEGGLACYRSWKSVKRGFSQVTPEDLGSDGLGAGDRLQGLLESELGCMALTKRQKVQVESLSSKDFDYEGEKDLSPQERVDKKTRSADTGECDSAVPRVNVLKLRKCSTGKGGWRVAGNSCMADRSGDGGEPLTPSSTADRKRSFSECFEFNQPESPEENGHQDADGHESGCNTEKAKVKGLWSNCEVSSINDVTFNPRKRFKNGSTSSGTSEDSYATHYRTEETYPSSNLTDHVYPDSVCRGCIANVLVVQHDRGWREFGATIELQSCHGQGWMLIISVRGQNTYAFKAEHAIVTGSTNRHTHAVVWKGGKGWSLEFDDKKQWQIFKELHEECYRRNAKTSSVRQIPIPGVRHIEDIAPRSPNGHFARPYSRYISTGEDEVEMALGNSRVVYDMDSEDEQWLVQINHERASARGTRTRPLIAEETLERLMDKLEKDAYLYQQEHKTTELDPNDVDSESCMGLATPEVIKVIYSYWLEKRKRKGMPLVRHFQPPAWEQYQKLLRLWEQEIARLQQEQPSASMQQLTEAVRKPPYFAFCLRPRGLEAQHKLSKQKSHRKQSWPGTAPRPWGGMGSLDALGRRQYYTEPGNGLPPGPRRPGRPRLSDTVGANLTGAFNMMREPGGAMTFRSGSLNEYAQRRAGKNKKSGRKARKQHLLAAQESRRKRSMMLGELQEEQPTDLALLAARKRSTAEALRARAQALYAVADAAMHKAVAAVIAADAQHAAEQSKELEEEQDSPPGASTTGEQGPTFGSWRRGVAMSKASASHRPGLESYGEDALLPVASWSQELGAGLGTRLLNKEAEVEGIMAPLLGRMRGEGMVAMPTR